MNPVTNNTISTDTLNPTPVLPIASNVVDPNVYNSAINNTQADIQGGLQNAQSEVDATRKNAKDQSLAISTLQSLSGSQGAETIKQYDEKGVTGLFNQLTDLNSQATGLKNEAQAIPIQLQNQSANRGVTVGGIAPIQSAQLRENALKALSLGQQYAIASGNYEKAKDYADRAITAKYQQIDADIKAKQTNLATLEKYDLTPAENKLLGLQQAKLKKEEQDNADRKEKEKQMVLSKIEEDKTLDGLIKSIAEKGNASSGQIEYLVKNAKTIDDFYTLGGGDFLSPNDTKFIEMPDGSTIMVNAKTGDKIRDYSNKPAEQSGTNQNALTYARQYATDGKLPSLTDLQKLGTSPSEITRMAKELPKQVGQIVSTQTGVKDTSVPAAAQDDFTKLYNITQNIIKLKELDKNRIGGLVAGGTGLVFGSGDQAAYLTARKAIVDDLSRMQSGAALSLDEVAFYEDYLPGRFSEFLNLGQDSMKKIENFETQMNNKLKDRLGTSGLSIYGYSTVNLGGKDYKIGDEIEVNGIKGRVLPGGEISVQESRVAIKTSANNSNKVVGGVDLKGYAVDANQSKAVASIYDKIPDSSNPEDYTNYIKSKSPKSKINGNDIVQAAESYNLEPKILLALMQHESNIGTSSVALNNNNFGGITWSESYAKNNPGVMKGSARPANEGGYYVKFATPLDGLTAQAKLLSKRKIA